MTRRYLVRVLEDLILLQSTKGADSPKRRQAIEEIIEAAMKADTLDLLDRLGLVPEELRYKPLILEGEDSDHGRHQEEA